ncbi:MAG: hypothetical protein DRJ01_04800 [Bacteroidetes bacterium]|nr:MAG: hypothetical protein DRJ01_04800 [Bacteroidota bacterium]
MEYGIAYLSIIPVRSEPDHRSEMVTQILFGEHFKVLEKNNGWCFIHLFYDDYEGWIDEKMCYYITPNVYESLSNEISFVSHEIVNVVQRAKKETPFMIVSGSNLPFYNSVDKSFKIDDEQFYFYGDISEKKEDDMRASITDAALNYVDAPYLWGGRSPFGIDCSGLTQIVYKLNGIKIPRDASQQVELGKAITFADKSLPGDLAFFDDEEGNIIHVGIVLNDKKIIHASGKVRVDLFDHQGIFNNETKKYSHRLRVIKQIV